MTPFLPGFVKWLREIPLTDVRCDVIEHLDVKIDVTREQATSKILSCFWCVLSLLAVLMCAADGAHFVVFLNKFSGR